MDQKYLTAGQAAEIIGISLQALHKAVSKNTLKPALEIPSKSRTQRFYDEKEIQRYKTERTNRGK